jgi:hypothetical protein
MSVNKQLRALLASCVATIALVLSGCDQPIELDQVQYRVPVSLSGEFLTESPDEIEFPVKILFAIDMSLSMGDEVDGQAVGSDPNFLRLEAVRNFIDEYNVNDNTSFEIMLWSTDVFETTRNADGQGGFTKDPVELNRVLDLANNDTMTDYLGTLSTIKSDIQRDINNTANEANVARTKYIVVFLSDGVANVRGVSQSDSDIWRQVEEIKEMTDEAEVGGFDFHTFLLLGGFPPTSSGQEAQTQAEKTLEGMADRGTGTFNLFETAESIDFLNLIDVRLTVEYQLKYLFAYNFSAIPGTETLLIDSDTDGLSNEDEVLFGTDPFVTDTDGDGMGDYFEILISSPGYVFNPTVADSPCEYADSNPDGSWPDTDRDGLTDCEEFVKGTDRYSMDTDFDGIPDSVEVRVGTNPFETEESRDTDFDGDPDWLEVQRHTNVKSNDPILRENYGYDYHIENIGLVALDQGLEDQSFVRQYDFLIDNIDLVNTQVEEFPDRVGDWLLRPGDNLIRFYIAQTPEDRPDSPPVYRVAEIIVNVFDDRRAYEISNASFERMH